MMRGGVTDAHLLARESRMILDKQWVPTRFQLFLTSNDTLPCFNSCLPGRNMNAQTSVEVPGTQYDSLSVT